jgi:hypothetical protein
MKSNCSVTIYNQYTSGAGKKSYKKTIIKFANWQGKEIATASSAESTKGMLNIASETNVFIPFINDFQGKTYVDPKSWDTRALDADRDKYFTFQQTDRIVKGVCSYEFDAVNNPITKLDTFDNVVTIMSAIVNDNGSLRMQHYQIGGK